MIISNVDFVLALHYGSSSIWFSLACVLGLGLVVLGFGPRDVRHECMRQLGLTCACLGPKSS